MYFNGDESLKISLHQHVFIKRDGIYKVMLSSDIVIGDYLIKLEDNGLTSDLLITSISIIDGVATVYRLNTEPQDWFVTEDILMHNYKWWLVM